MLGACNIVSTIMTMRAAGQTLHRMPLFVWAILAQSIIIILCIPVLAGIGARTFTYLMIGEVSYGVYLHELLLIFMA